MKASADWSKSKMDGKRFWDPSKSVAERLPNDLVLSCEQPGIMPSPHWHAQVEVNYIFRGSIDYAMHGHRVRFEEGDLALFWGGLPHRVVDTGQDTYYHAIHLPLLHFFRLRFAPDLQQRLMRGATLVTGEPCEDDAPAFTRRARALLSADGRVISHATDELLLRLERIGLEPHRIHEPNEAGAEPADAGDNPSFETIRRICGFIAENFRSEFDAVDVAVAADIHPKYAMSVFKRSTGMSLGEYVSLMRISFAQAQLRDGEESITQIAMDSGFGSLSAFNKCFRKKTGTTPSEFRRARHRPVSAET